MRINDDEQQQQQQYLKWQVKFEKAAFFSTG